MEGFAHCIPSSQHFPSSLSRDCWLTRWGLTDASWEIKAAPLPLYRCEPAMGGKNKHTNSHFVKTQTAIAENQELQRAEGVTTHRFLPQSSKESQFKRGNLSKDRQKKNEGKRTNTHKKNLRCKLFKSGDNSWDKTHTYTHTQAIEVQIKTLPLQLIPLVVMLQHF